MKTNELIDFYIDNDILISPEFIKELEDSENPLPIKTKFIVLDKDTLNLSNTKSSIVAEDFEKAIVMKQKRKNSKLYDLFIDSLKPENTFENKKILELHKSETKTELKPEIKSQAKYDSTKNTEKEIIETIDSNTDSKIHTEIKIEDTNEIGNSSDINVTNLEDPDKNIPEMSDIETKQVTQLEREEFLKKNKIKITSSYTQKSKKWVVADFVSLYNVRYKDIEKILRSRQELQNLTSISRITAKKEKENVALVGMVYEKALTKAGNIIFTLEDPTGPVKVVVNKNKDQMFKLAEEIQLDEIIGITGTFDGIIFANSILIPDIPLTKELKKSPDEGYMLIISDTQVGGKLFLEKEFDKLISWINGEVGNERQKQTASRIKYIFIAGDLVEGVGIYPNQEYDLSIIDVKDQYKVFADMLKKLPSHIPILLCPGNHDVGRLSEPQLPLSKEYANPLLELSNVISLSNPSSVNIFAQPENNFDGLDIMFYHGGSLIYYSEHLPVVRQSGGQKRPDLIMKYWLQRRHLAPTHGSTLYIPDPKKDPLFIDKVPDILITGHIHRTSVSSYKNVTCFNASCWVAKSPEQERRGLEPQPARAFIVDMHTREVKVMNFLSKEDQDKEAGIVSIVPAQLESENKTEDKSENKEVNKSLTPPILGGSQ